jgi:hypothetical protein
MFLLGPVACTTEVLFVGIVMLADAGVLTWMVVWMRRQASTQGAPQSRFDHGGGFSIMV